MPTTLKVGLYNVRKFHRPRMSDGFLAADSVDTTSASYVVVQQLRCSVN